jgi:hypothetical protein
MRKLGAGESEILGEVERHNLRCLTPLHARELQKLAASAARGPL